VSAEKTRNFFQEAKTLKKTIKLQGFSQTYAAKRLGFTQSALSNKLRLLQLSPVLQEKILASNLTERHARALLRLPEERREIALKHIILHRYNVSTTEAYIDELLLSAPKTVPAVCKELLPIYESIHKAAKNLQSNGHLVEITEHGGPAMITIHLHVHKK